MQEGQSQDQSWQGTVLSPNSQCKVAVASQPCCVRAPLLRGLATWQTAADRPLLGLQALAGPGSPSLLSPLSFSPSAGRRVGVILTVGYTGIALCELPQTPHPQASRHHTTGNPPQPCPTSAVGSSQPRSSPTSWRVSSPQPPPPDATDTRAGRAHCCQAMDSDALHLTSNKLAVPGRGTHLLCCNVPDAMGGLQSFLPVWGPHPTVGEMCFSFSLPESRKFCPRPLCTPT